MLPQNWMSLRDKHIEAVDIIDKIFFLNLRNNSNDQHYKPVNKEERQR